MLLHEILKQIEENNPGIKLSDMGNPTEEVEEIPCPSVLPGGEACTGKQKISQRVSPSNGQAYSYVEPCRDCELALLLHGAFGVLSPDRDMARQIKDSLVETMSTKPTRTKTNAAAMDALRKTFANANVRRGVVLLGPVGTGKTFLALHALNALVRLHGKRCMYLQEQVLFDAWRMTHSKEVVERDWGRAVIERARSVDWVLLDDLGQARRSTPGAVDILEQVIMWRYDAGLPVIVTSNQREEQVCETRGSRVWSRIMGLTGGNVIELLGDDWRRE